MKKSIALIMIITILSKLLGFTRDIILSYFYGASTISDAYLISLTIPVVIFGMVTVGISAGYIPVYTKIEHEENEQDGIKFTNNIINLLLILGTVIVIPCLFFTEHIVKLFASGFEGNTLDLAVRFTRISIFGLYITSLLAIFKSYLQVKGSYLIPALVGFPINILTILAIYFSTKGNVMILSIGSLVALFSQLAFLLPFAFKKGYFYKLKIDLNNKHVKTMINLSFPVIIGTSVTQLNLLVDRTIASTIVTGGVSALTYASKLKVLIQSLFVTSIVTVLYPKIAKLISINDMKNFKLVISRTIVYVNLLVIPASIGMMFFAEEIIKVFFARGAFDSNAVVLTSAALFFYSFGILGFGLREILSRSFYSFHDTRTPMINAIIGMTLNILLNIVLSKYMGIGGLALASSISALITTLLLFISLKKKIGDYRLTYIVISTIKIIIASLIMGGIARYSYIHLNSYVGNTLSLFLSVIIGVISYVMIVHFSKLEEIDEVVKVLKKKLKMKLNKE